MIEMMEDMKMANISFRLTALLWSVLDSEYVYPGIRENNAAGSTQ